MVSHMTNKHLTNTSNFLRHVYWYTGEMELKPKKDHIGVTIKWTDIVERRSEFLDELINSATAWVYSKQKSKEIFDEKLNESGGEIGIAAAHLTRLAHNKFRNDSPQGQFGELILFNFIQHFFQAIPLLRKQRITTSTGHERFGSDAIHYRKDENFELLILGESKCYESKYQFNAAFKASIESISNSVNNLSDELKLYTFDDFIEPNLQTFAKDYKNGKIQNIRMDLVSIIIYNEVSKITSDQEDQIHQEIIRVINEKCKSVPHDAYDKIEERYLSRINWIIFPIWKLDQLLDSFSAGVRVK